MNLKQPVTKKILLTGFKPFGNYSINVADLMVSRLEGTVLRISGDLRFQIIGLSVPINFETFRGKVEQGIIDNQPDIVICLGMDFKDQIDLALETRARPQPMYGDFKDQYGRIGPLSLLDEVPGELVLPNQQLIATAISDVPGISLSTDAGSHMCETLFRDCIRLSETGSKFQPIFIHLPHTPKLSGKPVHIHKVDFDDQKAILLSAITRICLVLEG